MATVTVTAAPETLKEKLQKVAAEMKLSSTGLERNSDGSVSIMVKIDADDVTVLEAWAEGAGEDFATYLQRTTQDAIKTVVMS